MASPPSKLDREIVQKAVNSLFKWRRAHSKLEHRDDDDYFNLVVTLQRIPSGFRRGNYRIELPTPLRNVSETDICLIVDDRRRSMPERVKMMKSKSKLKSDWSEKAVNVSAEETGVSKVLKISKLKTDYRALEEKRKLWNEYDVFLAEKKIVEKLPVLLGKHFYKNKKKVPLEVELERGMNWKEEVEKVVGSGYMHLSKGTCSVVKIGRLGMEKEKIVENVVAAIERIVEVMPKKWDSIRAFHLKLNESLALPVYEALPDLEVDNECVEEGKKNAGGGVKREGEKKDEIVRKKGSIDGMDEDDSDDDVTRKGVDANGKRKTGAAEMAVDGIGSKKRRNTLEESVILRKINGQTALEVELRLIVRVDCRKL